ncbi:perlwapin-like [Limulus polyphemus]|uniref:Perlwapin-like n=1 Tax=Limulus polyphemus TaxID=6850 RepID=A0ABM1BFS8_LIMPO|nr:perlwapin-like [Limulus polyphemus]
MSQRLSFPFGPKRRVLPGQRGDDCTDCVADFKDCVQECLREYDCTTKKTKEGFCPIGDPRPSKCSPSPVFNVCDSDQDCPGTKKCCEDGCSKVCAVSLPRPPSKHPLKDRSRPPFFG